MWKNAREAKQLREKNNAPPSSVGASLAFSALSSLFLSSSLNGNQDTDNNPEVDGASNDGAKTKSVVPKFGGRPKGATL